MLKVHLLVIDPQNDFCDPKGSLCVPKADEDMERVATLIERVGDRLMDIHVTLDTHHYLDVAHPSFWVDGDGNEPDPFIIITAEDVEKRKWRTKNPQMQDRAAEYVKQLVANGRYPLCIWPAHCLIGTWGNNVHDNLADALLNWEKKHGYIDYVTKGSNLYTEHYSAVLADVVDPTDPTTDLNTKLIQILEDSDMVLVAGEASSHCVANTLRDIIDNFGVDSAKKVTLLTDCMSPVPTFEQMEIDFFADMKAKGVNMARSTEVMVGAK